MTFERPAFLLVLPVLLALLWLARRWEAHRPRPFTAFLIARRAQDRLGPRPSERRFRWSRLRWIPAVVLLVGALAGPGWQRPRAEEALHVVIDRSASMGTLLRNGPASRLTEGLSRVGTMGPVVFHSVPPPPWDSPLERPTAATVPAQELVDLATDLLRRGLRTLVLTDLALEDLPLEVGLVQVGEAAPNAGITACGLDDQGRLLIRAASTERGTAGPLAVTWWVGEGPKTRIVAASDPRALRSVVDVGSVSAAPKITVELEKTPDFRDGNPLDDRVVLLARTQKVRVGFRTSRHRALQRAFDANPEVFAFHGDARADLFVGEGEPSVGVAMLYVAPEAPPGFSLGPSDPVHGVGTLAGPLARFSTASVDVGALFTAKPPSGDVEHLLTVGGRPLLVRQGDVLLLLADPDSGTWPAHPTFPLVWSELLSRLALRGQRAFGVERGVALVSVPGLDRGPAVLLEPDGRRSSVPLDAERRHTGVLSFPGETRMIPQGGSTRDELGRWSVAVLSRDETLAAGVVGERTAAPGAARDRHQSLEAWFYAAGAVCVVLAGCLPFQRGTGTRRPRIRVEPTPR